MPAFRQHWFRKICRICCQKSKSPTPYLYCCSRVIRITLYQSASSHSVTSWQKSISEHLVPEQ